MGAPVISGGQKKRLPKNKRFSREAFSINRLAAPAAAFRGQSRYFALNRSSGFRFEK
jgi:hypothetical protein